MQSTSILVVEDERIVAMDLSATLRRLGYTVPATASSGDEAIQHAAQHRPDLVLMDIRLSGAMDGIEVTERIRTDLDVPVIYLTAHTDRETQQRARRTAPYGYLVKPFDERTLQTTIDMTLERHGRDRQTRANEQRLLTTLASIGDAVLITDAAGRITFLNPVAEYLLHCSAPAVIGRPVDDVMPLLDAETRVPIDHPIRAVLRSGEQIVRSVETILIAQDGAETCIDDSAAPIRTIAGQIEGVAMVFRDATLRRQLAEAKQYERLRVLAGGIAHDLNNLLTVVIGNAELAQLDLDQRAPAHQPLEQIVAAAHRATDLTRHLLAYAGRSGIQLDLIDLNALVDETILLLSSGPLKHITVRAQLGPDLPRFEADAAQLQQVVQNLLVNAAEAIGAQPGVITATTALRHCSAADLSKVRFGAELRSGPYVVLEIADTGSGMDAATCERVFEPFFTTKFMGRGLGLAAVRGVIREHGGAIRVTSAPDQGTTFTILLPYVPGGKLTQAPRPAPTTWQRHGTVLVVDGEASVRSTIARVLERLGLKVLSAPDGSYALGVFQSQLNVIDCVLLDLSMPGMPSAEVARAMRAIHPTLPIVLMSGYSLEAMARSIQVATHMQFLPKPFQLLDLLAVLQHIFTLAAASYEVGQL